tara:strand:+ start:83 stop:526 length:444 start_codon:yes stop_codon:yes gene_type:complete
MIKQISIILLCFVLITSCKKEDNTPKIPEISLVSISPTTLVQFEEPVNIVIGYKDLDGDLGFENPDSFALQIKDNRLEDPDWYHVPPLSPIGSNLSIQGELDIQISSLFLLGNGSEEQTSFTIKMVDRAGNWSQEIMTPQLIIKDSL